MLCALLLLRPAAKKSSLTRTLPLQINKMMAGWFAKIAAANADEHSEGSLPPLEFRRILSGSAQSITYTRCG